MSEVNSVELARLLFAADGQEEDNEPGGSFDTAGETVQQHFLILAEIAIKFLALEASEEPRPMDTAPKNGQMLRLLVDFDDLGFENTADPGWTIGFNSFDLNYDDEWHFVGWCWSHDHYTEGKGTPVGWLPLNSFPERIALKAENERLREVLGEAREALDDALWLIKDVEKDTYMEVGEDRHDRIRNVRDAARALLNDDQAVSGGE